MKMWRLVGIVLMVSAGGFGKTSGQTVTNIYWFSGVDGSSPNFGLIQGTDGNFYGTTVGGATQEVCSGHCGTIFKLSPNGDLTNLYWFSGSDGSSPNCPIEGSDGNFYGTTAYGGTNGNGTVFRISSAGTLTTLYQFSPNPASTNSDGANPRAGLVEGSDGNFYGTTFHGGTNTMCGGAGCGTIFRITPSGIYTSLHYFAGVFNKDGQGPRAPLVQSSDGNFYGTTVLGGSPGGGTVFRISPSGSYTNLHSFSVTTDGEEPLYLVEGTDGNFYGTAYEGGTNNEGTIFRISPSGGFTNLYTFGGIPTQENALPNAIVQGSDGNFYGTTYDSCAIDGGTVYRINPNGGIAFLYSFCSVMEPNAIVQGSDGNFYFTTYYGGSGPCDSGCGGVFELIVSLTPPANQISSAQVDSSGTNLVFSIPSVASETYQLQFSPSMNPANWVNVSGTFVSNSIGALLTLTNFGGVSQPQGFYRFAITP